jgi:hypothetical protein
LTEEDKKKWGNLVSGWQHVDYRELKEADDETDVQQESSCAGGSCELR